MFIARVPQDIFARLGAKSSNEPAPKAVKSDCAPTELGGKERSAKL